MMISMASRASATQHDNPMTTVVKADPIPVADWRHIHAVADTGRTQLIATIRRLLASIANQPGLDLIDQALADGNIQAAVDTLIGFADTLDIPETLGTELVDAMTELATTTAQATASELGLTFDLVNPRAVAWARQHGADLITGFTTELRDMVRQLVARGIREGIPPRSLARILRSSIGLTERWGQAVVNFRARIAGTVTDEVADRRAARYAERLLRRRAEMIARTETMRAANEGQRQAWEVFADRTGQEIAIVWIVTPDSRLCPICAPLDGKVVGIRESFKITEQATGFDVKARTGDDRIAVTGTKPLKTPINTRTPPAHVNCRCALGLTEDARTAQREAAATQLIADAKAAEGEVTDTLQGVAAEFGGEMEGLKFKIKGRDSLLRKMRGYELDMPSSPMSEVAARFNDTLRYTMVVDEAGYSAAARAVLDNAERFGWSVVDSKKYWLEGGNYRGINAVLRTASGQKFELQFHTPLSLRAKVNELWPLYNQQRVIGLPMAEVNRLEAQMVAVAERVPIPDGLDLVPGRFKKWFSI